MRHNRSQPEAIGDGLFKQVPLLSMQKAVVFPRNVVTLQVGRPRSIHAVEEAMMTGRLIALTAHRDSAVHDPRADELFDIATLGNIISADRQPGGNLQVVLEGIGRIRLSSIENRRPFFTATIEEISEPTVEPDLARTIVKHIHELALRYSEINEALTTEMLDMIKRQSRPGQLADMLATQVIRDVPRRQQLLELIDPIQRLERLGAMLAEEIEQSEIEQRVRDRITKKMDNSQREHFIRQQIEALQNELDGEEGNEFHQLHAQIDARHMPADAAEKLHKEVNRLERMPNVSAESTVGRTWVETLLQLPWTEQTDDQIDLAAAEAILDQDHYGLEQVKERILEFLAVRSLTREHGINPTSQILCLAGPPGVGKTSLGRSIAEAIGRRFVLVSLGGVRDEAEIRGHRRTYIGAMPGRVVNAMKTAGAINPVILLDEIDKLASDYRGDPTAALLEVLDPQQNRAFNDHYLDTPYDLSRVLFITTANYINQIPGPLRDRMEMLEVTGYTEDEKIEIARRHLLRRNLESTGLHDDAIEITPDVWRQLIRDYTREAGVRGLEREIARLTRKVATRIVRGKAERNGTVVITSELLEDLLGPKKYGYEQDFGSAQIGLAIGLAASELGGEIIPVEVATMSGHGNLTITGQAGDVMQESARAALSYARSRADELRIDRDFQEKLDLHIHLSEGATPKDGPSAGITMATALISAVAQRPIRNDTAMTGEITLRGRVLPIGGLRDKTLAAHRHGIRRIIIPVDNQRDLRDIPENVRSEMDFVLVKSMDEVIQAAIMLDIEQADQLRERTDAPSYRLPTTTALDARPRR